MLARAFSRTTPLPGFVKNQFDRGCQVVIANPMGNASKVAKGLHVGPQKTFLVLRGKTSGVGATRVTEMHHEKLHFLSLAIQDSYGLTPIHLSILARLEFQR